MNIDSDYKNKLISTYRTELFERDGINPSVIDDLISDSDLKIMISLNNSEMCELINKQPIDKERIKKIFVANVNFYKLAKYRDINIPGTSLLMTIASAIDYNVDKLYDELNVGRYIRPFKTR